MKNQKVKIEKFSIEVLNDNFNKVWFGFNYIKQAKTYILEYYLKNKTFPKIYEVKLNTGLVLIRGDIGLYKKYGNFVVIDFSRLGSDFLMTATYKKFFDTYFEIRDINLDHPIIGLCDRMVDIYETYPLELHTIPIKKLYEKFSFNNPNGSVLSHTDIKLTILGIAEDFLKKYLPT